VFGLVPMGSCDWVAQARPEADEGRAVSETAVNLDPALIKDLTEDHELAATVHVLRARAEDLRGRQGGARALILALRAIEVEQQLLDSCGLEGGAAALREMEFHPVTLAAAERWRFAQQLARELLNAED